METKIGEVKGHTITYATQDKLFHLRNAEGEEVGSGKTQDDVEQQADKLAKQSFPLPIQALLKGGGYSLRLGRVTSVNLDDRSCRFVYQEKELGRSCAKVRLGHTDAYELTEHNNDIHQKVREIEEHIDRLRNECAGLIENLEKPINLAYFGLKTSFY